LTSQLSAQAEAKLRLFEVVDGIRKSNDVIKKSFEKRFGFELVPDLTKLFVFGSGFSTE
jgi:hypothetical protein